MSQRQQEAVEGMETEGTFQEISLEGWVFGGDIPCVGEPHEEAVAVLMVMQRALSWGLGGGI